VDYLPLFAAVKDRPVLVIGTGEIAERKIAFLHRAGARVQVVAEADFDEAQIDNVVPGDCRNRKPGAQPAHL